MDPTPAIIFHIAAKSEWEAQETSEEYSPAAFAHENFIHCSTLSPHLRPVEPGRRRGRRGLSHDGRSDRFSRRARALSLFLAGAPISRRG